MSQVLPPDAPPPFSRFFDLGSLGEGPLSLRICADEAERAALAKIDDLAGIDRLDADLRMVREGRTGLRVTGEVTARIRQICVVSLEPFETEVKEPVDVHFVPETDLASLAAQRRKAGEAEPHEEDLPDAIVDGRVDLGALAAEFLALGLDPYPKKPGVTFAEPMEQAEDDTVVSPFAALRQLKPERPQ